jgi:poly(3-hydroxybutyrate) depolymerase
MKCIVTCILLLASLQYLVSGRRHDHSRAVSGCGKAQFLPGLTKYRFGLKTSGRDRSYSYHLPNTYDKNKRYPVVVGFHGSSSIGAFFEMDTKLSEARYSGDVCATPFPFLIPCGGLELIVEQKIMVYPNGEGGSWADPTYHSATSIAEDIQFVADILTDIKSNLCVEEAKIFAVGMSNGGGFIGTLACDPRGSSLFAAFAAHSGAFYTDLAGPDNGCSPSKLPLSMLEIHGAADKTVQYTGGQGDGGPQPRIAEWVGWWATRNNCSDKRVEDLADQSAHHVSWTCGGVQGALQHYRIDKLGLFSRLEEHA